MIKHIQSISLVEQQQKKSSFSPHCPPKILYPQTTHFSEVNTLFCAPGVYPAPGPVLGARGLPEFLSGLCLAAPKDLTEACRE